MHTLPGLILIFALFVSIILIAFSLHLGITPMPTSRKVKRIILEKIPKMESGVILELGAGWGHLALPLAKRYPHLTIRAYEYSPVPYLVLKGLKHLLGLKNLKPIRKDFFKISFKEASGCVCYLYPGAMEKLKMKFKAELETNSFIISNTFRVPGLDPIEEWECDDLLHTRVFFYKC